MQTRHRGMGRTLWLGALCAAALWDGPCGARLANEGRNGLFVRSMPQVLALDDSQVDLATAALIVSEKWSDVVQGLRYRDTLDAMALEIQSRLEARGLQADHQAIPVINQYLFEELGFSAVPHANDPNDLFLHSVLDRRKGYCLSLSVLYLCLGERLGLPLYGVVVPGHFFVRYESGRIRFNIETTVMGGHPTDEHYRAANRVPEDDQGIYLRNLTKQQTLACLFNNFGVVYLDMNRLDLAVEALELGVRIVPNLAEVRTNLAFAYLRQGLLDHALLQYREACRINPNDAKIRQAIANLYLNRDQPNLAIPELNRSIELDPNLIEAYVQLAVAYTQKEQYGSAREVLIRGIAGHRGAPGLYSQLGEVYRREGNDEQAVEAYQKAVALDPRLVQANFGLGLCRQRRGQFDQAIAAYNKVLAVEPVFFPALVNVGHSYVGKKEYPAAIAAYQKALEVDANDAGLHHSLGAAYAETKEWAKAVPEFERALALDPRLGHAHYGLGVGYYNQGKVQEAWDHLILARELGVEIKPELLGAVAARLPAGKK
ncbi:MAG: tetratricopeptide repeat protein [Phycisphaerae bacterium]|nr:tetratricopeptide repeat protein [Phycisphaerae bacterium]